MGKSLKYFDGDGREYVDFFSPPRYCTKCGTILEAQVVESERFNRRTGHKIKMIVWDCPNYSNERVTQDNAYWVFDRVWHDRLYNDSETQVSYYEKDFNE